MSQVMVALPTLGKIQYELWEWTHTLDKCGHDVKFFPIPYVRPSTLAHKVMRDGFLASGADWCLKIDDDMSPPRDLLKMIDHGVDICSAHTKTIQHGKVFSLCFHHDGDGFDTVEPDGELFECDAVGSGCLLMSRAVLKDVPFPESEPVDLGWCIAAREKGFRVWFDTKRRCLHNTVCPL